MWLGNPPADKYADMQTCRNAGFLDAQGVMCIAESAGGALQQYAKGAGRAGRCRAQAPQAEHPHVAGEGHLQDPVNSSLPYVMHAL